jgi:antitoxin component YwqK of YwqJK toxin-antitoxin module
MLSKKKYANGQKVYNLSGDRLTYYYKNGRIKAEGPFINNLMEGEWKFYRESGDLWQVGHFAGGMKNGLFIRYDRESNIEYRETFDKNKLLKA